MKDFKERDYRYSRGKVIKRHLKRDWNFKLKDVNEEKSITVTVDDVTFPSLRQAILHYAFEFDMRPSTVRYYFRNAIEGNDRKRGILDGKEIQFGSRRIQN